MRWSSFRCLVSPLTPAVQHFLLWKLIDLSSGGLLEEPPRTWVRKQDNYFAERRRSQKTEPASKPSDSSVKFDSPVSANSSSARRKSRRRFSSATTGSSAGVGKFSSIF